jgi:hypothetical protein
MDKVPDQLRGKLGIAIGQQTYKAYDLCAALVREGLGKPETWQKCGENAQAFAQTVIADSIGEERWSLLKRNVEYHLTISEVAERDGDDAFLENGRLALTIECNGAGFLKIGPVIDALEKEEEGLGAAFYWNLTYALYRVMRIYNHDDAFEYEERMREYAEEDEENRSQYEFPEVEKALPECIQKTLKRDHRTTITEARRLLSKHMSGRYGSWIKRLSKIQLLSRIPIRADQHFREDGIVALAKSTKADLIVLGARRTTSYATNLTKSVVESVLAEAECPVMTICTA